MDVLGIIFIGLLMGWTEAELTRIGIVNALVSPPDDWANFTLTLACEADHYVYVVSAHYAYGDALCTCLGVREGACSTSLSPSNLDTYTSSCWHSSSCLVSFKAPPFPCNDTIYHPQRAFFTYVCASATPALTIDAKGSVTGSSISAGYSTRNVSERRVVCTVEMADCSRVGVELQLAIRNDEAKFSSFFSVPGLVERLGQGGVSYTQLTLQTPFSVALNVLSTPQLKTAYLGIQAATNVTVTCGQETEVPPTTLCHIPILATPPARKSGQALTAVHSTTDQTNARVLLCVIEAEDCSVNTMVNVSLYVRNQRGLLGASFSVNNGLPETEGRKTLHTPVSVTLHLHPQIAAAYVHVQADKNITMTCGEKSLMLPTPACNVSIVSTPPSRKFGQALTAVHYTTEMENAGNWVCVIEAANCSAETPVNISVYTRPSPGSGEASFRVNGEESDAARQQRTAPVNVTLHIGRNFVGVAYVYVSAMVNVSLSCGEDYRSDYCDQCASSPCSKGFLCSNVSDSFACRCPEGHRVDADGLTCVGLPMSEFQTQSQTSIVGPAVGGAIGALAVIVIVVVVIVVVCRARSRKKKTIPTRPVHFGHLNTAYEEANHPDEPAPAGAYAGQQQDTTGPPTSDDANVYDVLGQKRPSADAKGDVIYEHLRLNGSVGENMDLTYDFAARRPRQDVITGDIYMNTARPDPDGKGKQNCGQCLAGKKPSIGVRADEVSHAVAQDSSAVKFTKDDGGGIEVKVIPNGHQNGEVAVDLGVLPANTEEVRLPDLQMIEVVQDDGSYLEVKTPAANQPNGSHCVDLGKDLAKPVIHQPESSTVEIEGDDGAYEEVNINPGFLLGSQGTSDLGKINAKSDKQSLEPHRVKILEDGDGYLKVNVTQANRQRGKTDDELARLLAKKEIQLPNCERVEVLADLDASSANCEIQLPESGKVRSPADLNDSPSNGVLDFKYRVPADLSESPANLETQLPESEKPQVPVDLEKLLANSDTDLPDPATVEVMADDGSYREVNVKAANQLQQRVAADLPEGLANDDVHKLMTTGAEVMEEHRDGQEENPSAAGQRRDDVETGKSSADTDSETEHVTHF